MSLAFYASPIDDSYSKGEDNYINKKRTANNKTQKRYTQPTYLQSQTSQVSQIPQQESFTSLPSFTNNEPNTKDDKINNILNTIHNLPPDDGENNFSNFTPLSLPISAGIERQQQDIIQQPKQNIPDYAELYKSNGLQFYESNPLHLDHSTQLLTHQKQVQRQSPQYTMNNGVNNDMYVQKLNYIINLLEQAQDEKTANITEEIILYIFLGIFIIFLIDSFVRVGRYIR